MMKKNKRLFAPGSPGATPSKKEGIRSWLKIQVESEGYQPPRGGVVFLQVLVGLLFFVFVVRFWYLQVHRGEEFARQAQENRLRQERIFAPRGRILDDGDKLLADNRTAYGLSLVREDCHDIPATLAQISAWSGIPLPQIWEKYQQDRFKVKSFEPLLLITDIDFDLVARIESEIYAWPGLEIVVRTKRSYPEKELFAHVLGYVAEANEQEMAKDPALAMGDLVGKQGLELELEKQLRGRKGLYDVEVDAHARVLGKALREEPRGGHGAGHGQAARPGHLPGLRQQSFRGGHFPAGLGRPAHQQPLSPPEPGDPERLPAGLGLEAGHGRPVPGTRRQSARNRVLPRPGQAGQPDFPLLEKRRARGHEHGKRAGQLLRRLFLPHGRAPGH